jgi:hypothetical protein
MATKRGENEAFNTKRLPLPRLECFASREMALQNLGDAVHFWPSRRPKPKGPSPGDTGGALNIQDELQNMRAERGSAVADANVSFGAVDQAKKVRCSFSVEQPLPILHIASQTRPPPRPSKSKNLFRKL